MAKAEIWQEVERLIELQATGSGWPFHKVDVAGIPALVGRNGQRVAVFPRRPGGEVDATAIADLVALFPELVSYIADVEAQCELATRERDAAATRIAALRLEHAAEIRELEREHRADLRSVVQREGAWEG